MSNYVTPRVAAKALGVNARTLARWETSGKIKAIKTDSEDATTYTILI